MINLTQLLNHQAEIQTKLQERIKTPNNIAFSWLPTHFGVNMLDNIIEECIEVKRLIKARKWWTSNTKLVSNIAEVNTPTPLRTEVVEELADVLIQYINTLYYLGVSENELEAILNQKLNLNNPDNQESTIGHRS